MNKTPDTRKMDLGQNFLEESLLIFSEAKASWVYTRIAQKKMPKAPRMHTLTYKVASNLKKSRSFSPSVLLLLNFPLYMFLTARSPFRKKNNESHWIIALQSWIKVGYIGDHLCSGAYTLVRNMEVRRVVATLPWAFDELWLRSISFRKQNQDCVGIRIEV